VIRLRTFESVRRECSSCGWRAFVVEERRCAACGYVAESKCVDCGEKIDREKAVVSPFCAECAALN
jgi:ribosomal protein L37E